MKRLICSRRKFGCIGFTAREQVLLPLQGCQPGGGGGGTPHGTHLQFQVQLHTLCLEGKMGKDIHKLVCFDSEMLFLTRFGLGCQGKVIPDLCGEQPTVALPEFWSGWTSLRGLRDVEDTAPSWAGLVFELARTFSASPPRLLLWICQCRSGNAAGLCSLLRRSD